MSRQRTDRDTIARLTREVQALTEERAHMRRLAHTYRLMREAAGLSHGADVTKALSASRRAHALAEEIVARLIEGGER